MRQITIELYIVLRQHLHDPIVDICFSHEDVMKRIAEEQIKHGGYYWWAHYKIGYTLA